MSEDEKTTERIVLGIAEEPGEVLRALFAIAAEQELDPRVITWVPAEHAVDVPREVSEQYLASTGADKPKRPRKAARTAAPPPPEKEE